METIVALGVIMTGLVSIISLTISNLNAQRDTATRYQAVNLAREAIELLHNLRDSNWISGSDPWEGIIEGENLAIVFNPERSAIEMESSGDARVRACADGHFAQGSSPLCDAPTLFSRTMAIDLLDCAEIPEFTGVCDQIDKPDPIALTATVRVTWPIPEGGEREVTLVETLYDWR